MLAGTLPHVKIERLDLVLLHPLEQGKAGLQRAVQREDLGKRWAGDAGPEQIRHALPLKDDVFDGAIDGRLHGVDVGVLEQIHHHNAAIVAAG